MIPTEAKPTGDDMPDARLEAEKTVEWLRQQGLGGSLLHPWEQIFRQFARACYLHAASVAGKYGNSHLADAYDSGYESGRNEVARELERLAQSLEGKSNG